MRIVNMILSVVLFISLPISTICLANNLAARMPDLYQYELKSTEILNELMIEQNEDELGAFFSEFMLKKTDKFQIEYQFGDNTDNLFTPEEQKTMQGFRKATDLVLWSGIGTLILAFLALFLLYKQNLKQLIRSAFFKAGILFAVLGSAVLASALIGPLLGIQYEMLFNYELKPFLVLHQLLPVSFFRHLGEATVGLAFIGMGLLWYFIWKITKPRRIFGSLR